MQKYARFILVGIGGLLVQLGLTYLWTHYLHLWYLLSFAVSALITWTLLFLGNSLFTFRGHSREGYARKYLTFLGGYVGIFFINTALVYVATSLVHVPYLASIAGASALTSVVSFYFTASYVYHG